MDCHSDEGGSREESYESDQSLKSVTGVKGTVHPQAVSSGAYLHSIWLSAILAALREAPLLSSKWLLTAGAGEAAENQGEDAEKCLRSSVPPLGTTNV